jgi:hypothetical protein
MAQAQGFQLSKSKVKGGVKPQKVIPMEKAPQRGMLKDAKPGPKKKSTRTKPQFALSP